jgi:DNA repair exonuclease SbcCD nuclease subunit
VGLLHTSLDGRPYHDPYAPTRLDVLRRKDYDYWALGHVHAREVVCERPRVVYSGNPQGRHARETGAKSAELVEWDGVRLRAQAIELDTVRWAQLSIPADGIHSVSDFQQCCIDRLSRLARDAGDRLVAVRVAIAGGGALHRIESSRPGQLEAELRAVAGELPGARVWIEKVSCTLRPDYDRTLLAAGTDPIGELLRLIDRMAADDAALVDLGRRALEDLHAKLPGELKSGSDPLRLLEPDVLRELLPQAESTLIARLLDGLR